MVLFGKKLTEIGGGGTSAWLRKSTMSGQKCILRMNVRGRNRKGSKERVTGQGEFSMVLKSSDVVQPTANFGKCWQEGWNTISTPGSFRQNLRGLTLSEHVEDTVSCRSVKRRKMGVRANLELRGVQDTTTELLKIDLNSNILEKIWKRS
jgi:hypothetical protein